MYQNLNINRWIKQNVPVTSDADLGLTMPVLGLTQYFFGEVVFTWKITFFFRLKIQWSWIQVLEFNSKQIRKWENKKTTRRPEIKNGFYYGTLKATYWSVLLVNWIKQELCFFSSTLETEKGKE